MNVALAVLGMTPTYQFVPGTPRQQMDTELAATLQFLVEIFSELLYGFTSAVIFEPTST